jgi:DNA-binding transcriptional ArsR family regulator
VRFEVLTSGNIQPAARSHFVYNQSVDVEHPPDDSAARIAAAIGEPARARMLYCLMDNHARTSTELAVVAGVSPSTASVHLNRLRIERLVKVLAQGKHRYYSLEGGDVACVLEALNVLAGAPRDRFVPHTPGQLRTARTCYDHIAGTLGVLLHDRFHTLGWLSADAEEGGNAYHLTPKGSKAFEALGMDLEGARTSRRRFAFACLDWSERRSHVGGAIGAALLKLALRRKWVAPELDSRALGITSLGRREIQSRLGLRV